MVALARFARHLDTSDLAQLEDLVLAFVRGVAPLTRSGPLEALCNVFMSALQQHCAAGSGAKRTQRGFAFLHAKLIIFIEDMNPPAALRVLLAAAEAACAAQDSSSAESLLEAACAVYHRYCALPPHAKAGLCQIINALLQLQGLSSECYEGAVAKLQRYATSLPVRQDAVSAAPCMSDAMHCWPSRCTALLRQLCKPAGYACTLLCSIMRGTLLQTSMVMLGRRRPGRSAARTHTAATVLALYRLFLKHAERACMCRSTCCAARRTFIGSRKAKVGPGSLGRMRQPCRRHCKKRCSCRSKPKQSSAAKRGATLRCCTWMLWRLHAGCLCRAAHADLLKTRHSSMCSA